MPVCYQCSYLPALRYASAMLAIFLCLSVTSQRSTETSRLIKLVLTYRILHYVIRKFMCLQE